VTREPKPERMPPQRRWSFLVWSDRGVESRQFALTGPLMRRAVIGLALCILGLSTALAGFFSDAGERARHAQLKRENRLLADQLATQRRALLQLEGTLDDLQKRDREFRILAGLEPLSAGIYRTGTAGRGASPGAPAQLNPSIGRALAADAYDLETITHRVRNLRSSVKQAVAALERKQDRLAATPSIVPTDGFVSSTFTGQRWHPVLEANRPHAGVDIAAAVGTAVFAPARGRVSSVGARGQYGLMVELNHGNGYVTRYAHLSRVHVRLGEMVSRRRKIGEVGQTGLTLGPHLHYEVWLNGTAKNPLSYIFDQPMIPDSISP
jgi:murein DD-endopeptidase MepM/ murein hydrolase activator NlpD